MDKSWINSRPFGKAHLDGVSEFMKLVSEKFDEDAQILCPCRRCLNRVHSHTGQVEDHLLLHGMASTYTNWVYHGEGSEPEINEVAGNEDEEIGFNEDVGLNQGGEDYPDDDRLPDMVHELYNPEDEGPGKKAMFAMLLELMKKELGPGSPYTRFSFVVRLLHIKSFYRISNAAFNAVIGLVSSAFPKCSIPSSYQEAKKLIRALGLEYVSIHVWPNNCVLFWKDYEEYDNCPVCHASRWKDTSDSEDETEWQYASDCDEGRGIGKNQEDEGDSDGD